MTDYTLAAVVPDTVRTALEAYPPLLQQLLYTRGITDAATAQRFLEPRYDTQLHDPSHLHDMAAAVSRLEAAIEQKQRIVIFADYDCDGIPGAVVLHDYFQAVGHDNVVVHIPHRHYDGFGLSVAQVDHIATTYKPDLLVTIDCGTTDLKAVAQATTHAIDVIVTDHHEPKNELPDAVAVVNPKVGDSYPFPDLCGAAVVFKLIQALLQSDRRGLPEGREKWWLDMVGIATVADMVPLVDENRVLAHYGLTVLQKSRRPGLQQLLRKQRASQPHLTEDDIGFTIGPRINAASRMDTPEDAFWLLASTDPGTAGTYVDHLETLNQSRKTAVAQMSKELNQRVSVETELPPVLVYGNPEWRPSLVGLAANKLAETHDRPTFLWGRDGNEVLKGSCRSNGTTSVVQLMDAATGAFVAHGGHHMSGGFTVAPEAIHELSQYLNRAYETLGEAAAIPRTVVADMELRLDDIDRQFVAWQQQCAPFGCDNPKPLYALVQVRPEQVAVFGKTKEHTKLTFATSGLAREALAFFRTPQQFTVVPEANQPLTLLAHLEQSFFMGRLQTRLRIVDILPG